MRILVRLALVLQRLTSALPSLEASFIPYRSIGHFQANPQPAGLHNNRRNRMNYI